MSKKQLLIIPLLLITARLCAQQSHHVTDKEPAVINGLHVGYNIKSHEVKTVGDKGDFSRYAVRFYATNTTSEPKIILYKEGLGHYTYGADHLVQFNCLNATGARLTSKSATILAPPCDVTAMVDDKECGTNKVVRNKRKVQIGYWIKPGQTLSTDVILIVPLNEQPNVEAVYLGNAN
jgi:hypothetical protein